MKDSWYSFLPKKDAVHEWKNYSGSIYAYESPLGWIGIDADVTPSKDKFSFGQDCYLVRTPSYDFRSTRAT